MNPEELVLRRRLGIPEAAERVIIFGESSHWDPNWLFTSEQYYRFRIRHIFDLVIQELLREPRRVFCIESLFFLQLYWTNRPDSQKILRQLFAEGRLRLTGSGITTPDVTLPNTEAILRDYLLGQEWLREVGILAEPRLAYLPDDFGYSPELPSILRALGFEMTGITRIDGMYFIGTDYRRRSTYPIPESSAEKLLKQEKTQDFIWRATDGSEVLCHWNAFTYFQGDMLAHVGLVRWMGIVAGLPWRTKRHVARRIRAFVKQLGSQAMTPYMFCPIGCDFNGPIHGLLDLLDRYNQNDYPQTGVFALNAGLDDYLDLVNFYRDRLPILNLDPNPYWMGFYSSRPSVKRICNRTTRKLLLAERLGASMVIQRQDFRKDVPSSDIDIQEKLKAAWDLLVLTNHHDFITGTSPDRVWIKEQQRWLLEAEALADGLVEKIGREVEGALAVKPRTPPAWRFQDGKLEVESKYYRAVLTEEAGGCITSLINSMNGKELMAGPGNDLVVFRESGGLWRMGHEFQGGRFEEKFRASRLPAKIRATEDQGMLQVMVESELANRHFRRWIWFRSDTPIIRMRIEGEAGRHLTITCRFLTNLSTKTVTMDVPGGVVVRPFHKLYEPTFWPGRSFLHLAENQKGSGLAVFMGGPATASINGSGQVEWVALRNAPRERAYKFLPIASHPASGLSDEATLYNYAIYMTASGDWRDNQLPKLARQVLHRTWLYPGEPDLDALAAKHLVCDHEMALITAFKPAHRGSGYIARIFNFAPHPITVRLRWHSRPIRKAFLCDARERDGGELEVEDGVVVAPLSRILGSIRILF